MKVDIYLPRLDIPFKKSPVPKERFPVGELRQHWAAFVKVLANSSQKNGHKTRVIEAPLWTITPDLVKKQSANSDKIFIPHKMQKNWHLDDRILYYMQMVIPNIFSIDCLGWCASSSIHPIPLSASIDQNALKILRQRTIDRKTKFPQNTKYSTSELGLINYIFFPCQLPHDETIAYHSDISVQDALEALLYWRSNTNLNLPIVIKGHPANLGAMKPLKEIYMKYLPKLGSNNILWIDDIDIHDLLKNSLAIFTINSGVGFEALLHNKPVYTFGYSDYQSGVHKIVYGGSLENASKDIQYHLNLQTRSNAYRKDISDKCGRMVSSWYNAYYDYNNPSKFDRLTSTFCV